MALAENGIHEQFNDIILPNDDLGHLSAKLVLFLDEKVYGLGLTHTIRSYSRGSLISSSGR